MPGWNRRDFKKLRLKWREPGSHRHFQRGRFRTPGDSFAAAWPRRAGGV